MQTSDLRESIDGWAFSRRSSHVDISPLYASVIALLAVAKSPLDAEIAILYDLRSTFASNALAHGITVYELARIMGTSVGMIEAHYGALLDTAHESLLERLDAVSGMSRA